MRIDLHVRSSEATESSRSMGSNGAKNKAAAAERAGVQSDETHLSSHQARVQKLEHVAQNVPEVRHERVQALRTAIQEGRYQPPAEQVAEAMLSDAIARTDLLRR